MRNESSVQHILPEELTDYFAATLSTDREVEIEEHLAVCEACTEQARRVQVFSYVWDSWTAQAHGAAYQQAALATALQQVQAQVQDPGLRARLQHWQDAWAGRAAAAVRLVWEAPGHAVRLVTEGLEALVGPRETWDFVLATRAVRTRGGPVRGATRTRGQTPLTPRKPQARLRVQGTPQAALEIHVEDFPPGLTPLVLLIPMHAGRKPQVTQLERPQGGPPSLVARFANIAPGDYVVAFEPMEPSDA
jgi:hypothetical protein